MQKGIVFFVLFFLIAVSGSIFVLRRTPSPSTSDKQNLILITIDTMNTNHMGVYGYNKPTTPTIDKLSEKSSVFTNAYTLHPLTINSFYTLFNGTQEVFLKNDMSKRNPDLSKKTPTLTTIMKENGYQTAAFITNPALGMVAKTYFEKGFDTFSYSNISSPNVYSQYIFAYEYQNGAQATDKATNWIQENSEKPFFLWLHYNVSHMPYNPPKKYLCKLDPDCQNETKYQSLLKDRSASMPDAMPSCKRSVSPETIQKAEMLYDAEVLATDDLIKQVLSQLENQDLLKKSIIVITADHGEGFDHDMYHHGDSVYRSSMHIPLIIFDGSAPIKHSFDTLMDNSDTLPTILDLLHISSKNTFDGKSVAPLLKGKPFTKKPYVFMRTPPNESNRFAITNGKEKYTLYPRAECLWNNAQEELFVASDLYEEKNLSGNMSKSAKSLKETLLKQIKSQENQPKTPDDNKTLEKLRSIGY